MLSKKIILLFFLVIAAGLLCIFMSSCEEEKPIEASDDLTMTVVTNDESGQAVPNIEVTLKSNDGSYSKKVVSDPQGVSLFSLKDINCSKGDKTKLLLIFWKICPSQEINPTKTTCQVSAVSDFRDNLFA